MERKGEKSMGDWWGVSKREVSQKSAASCDWLLVVVVMAVAIVLVLAAAAASTAAAFDTRFRGTLGRGER